MKRYQINVNRRYVCDMENPAAVEGLMRKDWAPDPGGPLEKSLPIPWPDRYVKEFRQLFNPWVFFKNLIVLCPYYLRTRNEDVRTVIFRLVDRCLGFSEARDGLRFPVYRFDYEWRGVSVPAPWTSAYASGAVLLGLMKVFEYFEDGGVLSLAKEFLDGLAAPVDPEVFGGLWNSFVDDKGYLWFEEMPFAGRSKQPRILNGHIRAITGIHHYWTHVRDGDSLGLLRAGITTVEKNAMRYRRPGKVNSYDLLRPVKEDYGPKRTIDQQNILFKMTGDPVFARYRDIFAKDMGDKT